MDTGNRACFACDERFTSAETCDATQILVCEGDLVLAADKKSCFACADRFSNSLTCSATQALTCEYGYFKDQKGCQFGYDPNDPRSIAVEAAIAAQPVQHS